MTSVLKITQGGKCGNTQQQQRRVLHLRDAAQQPECGDEDESAQHAEHAGEGLLPLLPLRGAAGEPVEPALQLPIQCLQAAQGPRTRRRTRAVRAPVAAAAQRYKQQGGQQAGQQDAEEEQQRVALLVGVCRASAMGQGMLAGATCATAQRRRVAAAHARRCACRLAPWLNKVVPAGKPRV